MIQNMTLFQDIAQIVKSKLFFLMSPNGKEWDYTAVKKLPTSLKRITSKHHGDFYCLNCLHSFAASNDIK